MKWMKWGDDWVNMSMIESIYVEVEYEYSERDVKYYIDYSTSNESNLRLLRDEFNSEEKAQNYLDDRMNGLRS